MQRLTELISRLLETTPDKLTPDQPFKEFEVWDSLKYMMLVVQIEEVFTVKLTPEEIKGLTSLAQATSLSVLSPLAYS